MKLEASVKRRDAGGKCFLDVTLRNPSKNLVLMPHLQLRRSDSGERVLPVYYSDNYVSMVPQESKTLSIEVATADLQGQKPLLVLDGWNVDVTPVSSADCDVALNKNALVASWPTTGIPIHWFDGPLSQIKIGCGERRGMRDFGQDTGYDTGSGQRLFMAPPADISAEPSLLPDLFKMGRAGECTYTFPMKPNTGGYTVKLIFAERDFGPKLPPKNSTSAPETPRPNPDCTGKRVFNVTINDEPVLKNFDICVAAGKWDKAVVEEFKGVQPNKEGNITVSFQNGSASQPLINAIEVLPLEKVNSTGQP